MTRSMRIACLHIPQYALQCATRVDPSLRGPAAGAGAAIAMVDAQGPSPRIAAGSGPLHAPVVVACSRAAWALGVRLGMTATAARSISSEISVVAVDAAAEREAVRAIADALLALTPVVDLGGRVGAGGAHLAMYAEVPQKMRGHTFGDRALERLADLGLTGRIGIADDRCTAWGAAAYGADAPAHSAEARAQDHGIVTMVPRGGSAAFLAPRPLSLLAISPEVQHMLAALGVRPLGEFAALPAPSVARHRAAAAGREYERARACARHDRELQPLRRQRAGGSGQRVADPRGSPRSGAVDLGRAVRAHPGAAGQRRARASPDPSRQAAPVALDDRARPGPPLRSPLMSGHLTGPVPVRPTIAAPRGVVSSRHGEQPRSRAPVATHRGHEGEGLQDHEPDQDDQHEGHGAQDREGLHRRGG